MRKQENTKKRILLIMPCFYSYTRAIVKAIENLGFKVSVYYEEPDRYIFLFMRKLQRIIKTNFFNFLFNQYLLKRILGSKQKFDVLIVIIGNILNTQFVQHLKDRVLNSNGRSIYYTWDSLIMMEHKGYLAEAFDRRFSFDSEDVRKYKGWILLPLFYSDEYSIKTLQPLRPVYDMACICSFNKYRYEIIKKIQKANPELRICIKMYIGKGLYWMKKAMDTFYSDLDLSFLTFEPLTHQEIINLYVNSKVILDVTAKDQSGLSMRTIESIGMMKKIATNNRYIREYDFFSSKNVFIYGEEDNFVIDKDWLDQKYELDSKIYNKYSIDSWVHTILESEG